MFRRSRFSVQPKVTAKSRAAATKEAPPTNQEATETTTTTASESSKSSTVTEIPSAVTPSTTATSGEINDPNGDSTNSTAALQRRKRFSVKPKVAPGRPATHSRTQKSPIKPVLESPAEVPSSDLDRPNTSHQSESVVSFQKLPSPKQRQPSEEGPQPQEQNDTTAGSSALPSAAPPEAPLQTSGKQLESQVTDVPSRPPVKTPPSLPDKEIDEISEKAKTLVSTKTGLSVSTSASSLSKLLNDPSDLQRLAKAQKLRELLREQKHKDKKRRKSRSQGKEYSLDPAKMTMRDLIHYLPMSNPMKSSIDDMATENETVVPSSPGREEPPESAQEPQVSQKEPNPSVDDGDAEEVEDDEQEEAVMVPQVKVAEDGTLIIDEESLTVEVQRTKGPIITQDRDPIFERGSTTTYSSFRTLKMAKPWSTEETDMFFLAISMVGTDFSMICQLFPHRSRTEIKNKFKKEERENGWRIDKAFRDKRKLDIEYFSKLLEKILEFQKNKKKLKAVTKRNAPKKSQRREKGKKKSKKLSDIQEEDENEDDNDVFDLEDDDEEEEEGEKENDNFANEGETSDLKPKRQQKRKTKQDDLNEEPNNNKKKRALNDNSQGETSTPDPPDAEAALSENHASTEISEKTDDVSPSAPVKPAKLSRMRMAKPLLPLGRKLLKKPLLPSTRPEENTADDENENMCDGVSDQVNKEPSPAKQASLEQRAEPDDSSEEEYPPIQPPKPTRYGRMPKPTKPLTYSAKESEHSDAHPALSVDTAVSHSKSKPKSATKRGRTSKQQSAQESKKPKLVTLRASQSEFSDDEEETELGGHAEAERDVDSEDNTACVFVPASLRSPPPVITEVEETMEELDILANMPDVLGISQDALCHDVSWDKAQNQTGTAEPCEHQLDLLVDVIDYLSSEQTEVCEDESYNEAAQTLLTISNMMHLPQTESQSTAQDDITGELPGCSRDNLSHVYLEGNRESAVNSSNVASPTPESSNQICVSSADNTDSCSQIQLNLDESDKSSQPRKGRPKLKPKPNLAAVSRTAQPQSQPNNISEQTKDHEESNKRPVDCPPIETLSVNEEITQITHSPSESNVSKPMKLSTNKESEMTGIDQMNPVLPTSCPSVPEDQTLPHTEPNISEVCLSSAVLVRKEPTLDDSESHCNLEESDSHLSVLQTEENSSQNPASCDLSLESLEKDADQVEVSPGCLFKRSRAQEVKPVPNIPVILTSTPSRPSVVKEQDQNTSSENQVSQSTELSPCRDKQLQRGTQVSSMSSPATASKQSDSKFSNQDVGSTLETVDDKGLGSRETSRSCSQLESVLMVEPDLTIVQESSAQKELHVIQQIEGEGKSTTSSRRSRFPRVQPRITQNSTAKLQNKDVSEENDLMAAQILSSPKKSNQSIISTSGIRPSDNLSTTEEENRSMAITKSQAGQLQENCGHPVTVENSEVQIKLDSQEEEKERVQTDPHVLNEKDLVFSQKEETKVASPCTSRRRSQKVKPKVNIPPTSRSLKPSPQKSKDLVQKESDSASENEQGKILTSSKNETSLGSGPLSVLIPSFAVGATLSNEQPSTAEQKRADEKIVGQSCAVGSPSGHFQSENQSLSNVLFEHSSGNIETAGEKAICRDATSESSNNKVTFDTASAQSTRGENVPPIQEKCRNLDVEVVTVSQMEECDALQQITQSKTAGFNHQITDSIQDVLIPPEIQSEGAYTDGASASEQPVELSTSEKPTNQLLTEKPKSEPTLEVTSDSPKASVPQRRRFFPKVKPNLVSSPRRTSTTQRQRNSTESSEQQPVGVSQIETEHADGKTQIKGVSLCLSVIEGNAAESAITEATGDINTSSSGISIATTCIADTPKKSVIGHKDGEVSSRERSSTESEMSNVIAVDAVCSRTQSHPADDSTTASGFLSSKEPPVSSIQHIEEEGSSSKSSQSDLPSSSKTTSKAPQTRRGRLMKPTPNLGRSRPLQSQNQSSTQDATDTGAVGFHTLLPEVQPNIQEPVKKNIPSSGEECLPVDSASMLGQKTDTPDQSVEATILGCATQEVDVSQTTSTATVGEKTAQCSTLFPSLTSDQLPSDPDEPFFILSLTEIPVSSSGELMDTTMETEHYVGDTQHHRGSGQTVEPAVEESPQVVSYIQVSAAESDPVANTDFIKENPTAMQGGSTMQPPPSLGTKDNMNAAEFASKLETKPRPSRPPRRAKVQVKPDTSRTRGSRTLSADINQNSEKNELDTQQEEDNSLDSIKLGPAGRRPGDDASDKEIKTENTKTRKITKSNVLHGTAASTITKVQTELSTQGKQSTTTTEASTSQTVASCSHVTKQTEDTFSKPVTTSSLEESVQQTLEHSQLSSKPDTPVNQQSSSVPVEEESTTVSEYFFSDIFTPVGDD